jgi:hypothetical protein
MKTARGPSIGKALSSEKPVPSLRGNAAPILIQGGAHLFSGTGWIVTCSPGRR